MNRSLRRRGQHLVVAGALLGALIGAALGLILEDGQTSTAVAAPGRAGGAALAVSPPSSHPPASRAVGSGNRTAGNDSSGERRAESPDRPDKRHGNAHKDRAGGRDKPGKGKGNNKLGAACPAALVTADDKDPKNVVSNARCQAVAAVTAH